MQRCTKLKNQGKFPEDYAKDIKQSYAQDQAGLTTSSSFRSFGEEADGHTERPDSFDAALGGDGSAAKFLRDDREGGGSGLAEFMFTDFLGEFIPNGLSASMGLLWRLISYYPYLFIGAIILPRWIRSHFRKEEVPVPQ